MLCSVLALCSPWTNDAGVEPRSRTLISLYNTLQITLRLIDASDCTNLDLHADNTIESLTLHKQTSMKSKGRIKDCEVFYDIIKCMYLLYKS